MRALITDPTAVPAGLWRRYADRALNAGVFPDWLNRGEPYFTLNALVIDQSRADELVRATNRLAPAFAKATRAIAADVDRLVSFGFPWAAAELLAQEPETPLVLGRFDFVPDAAGHWWLVEFNADTPSGLREGVALDRLIHALAPGAGSTRSLSDRLGRRFTEQFVAAVTAPGGPAVERVGLVTDAGMVEDLAQFVFTRDLIAPALARRGTDVILGDLDNLGRRGDDLTLIGRPIQALYRYCPFENLLGRSEFPAIYASVFAGRLRLLNGLRGLLAQNKALLAWIWQHRDGPPFTPDERAAIRDHIPPTVPILDLPADFDYRHSVVKQIFGREGEEVYFGDRLTPDDWRLCRRWRSYIVQERIDVPAFEAVIWRRTGPARETVWPGVGAFVTGRQFAGCFTRFGGPIINHQAKYVATLVEAGDAGAAAAGPT